MRKLVIKIWQLVIIGLFAFAGKTYSQDCRISSDILIVANNTTSLTLNVSGLINDNMANNQGLCGVRLVFEHDRVENLTMTLTSPSGQQLILIGPGRINSASTDFINWNILFNPCSENNNPDPGIPEVWDNSTPWAFFTNYSGTYDPFGGCLEEFNQGNANGPWTLNIDNLGMEEGLIQYFELIFCESEGTDCEECIIFPGDYVFPSVGGVVSTCLGVEPDVDLLSINVNPIISADQNFLYVYKSQNDILSYSEVPNQTIGLDTGTYEICGIAYDRILESQIFALSKFDELESLINDDRNCIARTSNCITLRILEIENTVEIDTLFCRGDTIHYRGVSITEDFDSIFTSSSLLLESCDTLIYFSARQIQVNARISSQDNNIYCGQTVFLNGSQSNSSVGNITAYRWETMNGSLSNTFGPIVEVLTPGDYDLIVSSQGCTDTTTIMIGAIDSFPFEAEVQPAFCVGDSFVVTIIDAPFTAEFSFEGPAFIESSSILEFYGFEEGNYTLISTFGSCEERFEFEIIDETIPIVSELMVENLDCNNQEAQISISTSAVNPRFQISGPENFVTDQSTFNVSQVGIYNILVIDRFGCEDEILAEIMSDEELPEAQVNDLNIQCIDNVPPFDVIYLTVIDSVIWMGPNAFISNELNPTPQMTGLYQLQIFGANGCSASYELLYTIENIDIEFEVVGDNIDCQNPSTELCIDFNEIIDSVFWFYDNQLIANRGCITVEDPGMYIVELFSDKCMGQAEFELIDLSENIDLDVMLEGNTLKCDQRTILAEAVVSSSSVNLNFEWYQGQQLISNLQEIEITSPGIYRLVVTNSDNQCSEELEFEIFSREDNLANIEMIVNQASCYPEQGFITLSGFPGSISFGIYINNEVLDFRSLPNIYFDPGMYEIEIIDEDGCIFSDEFEIFEVEPLELSLGEDICEFIGEEIQLKAETNIDFEDISNIVWESEDMLSCDMCLNTNLLVQQNQSVSIYVETSSGCTISDTISIQIKEKQIYFIPNIFSPNGDGNNDDFVIYLSDAIIAVFDFRIFDRWGNLLLFRPEISGDKSNFVWDGFFNGKKVNSGVYVYMATLLLDNGTEKKIFGEINLIR